MSDYESFDEISPKTNRNKKDKSNSERGFGAGKIVFKMLLLLFSVVFFSLSVLTLATTVLDKFSDNDTSIIKQEETDETDDTDDEQKEDSLIDSIISGIGGVFSANVELDKSAEELLSLDYDAKQMSEYFKKLGFRDVRVVYNDDKSLGVFHKTNDVSQVSVSGNTAFQSGEKIAKKSPIVIYAYQVPKDAETYRLVIGCVSLAIAFVALVCALKIKSKDEFY